MKKTLIVLLFLANFYGAVVDASILKPSVSENQFTTRFEVPKILPKNKEPTFTRIIFINKELTTIIINKTKTHNLDVRDGIAYYPEKSGTVSGIFTQKSLSMIWKQENLKLKTTYYTSTNLPFGEDKPIYYAEWNKKTKEGFAVPVVLSSPKDYLIDVSGNIWFIGLYLLTDDMETIKNTNEYWKP